MLKIISIINLAALAYITISFYIGAFWAVKHEKPLKYELIGRILNKIWN